MSKSEPIFHEWMVFWYFVWTRVWNWDLSSLLDEKRELSRIIKGQKRALILSTQNRAKLIASLIETKQRMAEVEAAIKIVTKKTKNILTTW